VNAVMIPTPYGASFMMPVARVMNLYRRHSGARAVKVVRTPDGLDITASRTGKRVFLHVVNTNRTRSVAAGLEVSGMKAISGRVFEIAAPPELEIIDGNAALLQPVEKKLLRSMEWRFPPPRSRLLRCRLNLEKYSIGIGDRFGCQARPSSRR